jgi:rhodanese-related sulfurtransferase
MRTTSGSLISLALAATVLAGCGGGDDAEPVAEAAAEPAAEVAAEAPDEAPAEAPARPAVGLVTPQQAAELAVADGITVIDVRTPEEFAEGHIEGATLIDFYEPGFANEIAALDPDGEYLIYCRSGNRSGQTFGLMAELGFAQVWDLDGGVNAYGAAGLPLVR